jgi:hypothetical protein
LPAQRRNARRSAFGRKPTALVAQPRTVVSRAVWQIMTTSDDRQLSSADAITVDDDKAFRQQFLLDIPQNALNQLDHFLVGIGSAPEENDAVEKR